TDSKLAELLLLDELKPVSVAVLVEQTDASPKPAPAEPPLPDLTPADGQTGEVRRARQQLVVAKAVFAKYKVQFEETVRRGRDPDPYHDTQLIAATDKAFADLEAAIDQFATPQAAPTSKRLATDE